MIQYHIDTNVETYKHTYEQMYKCNKWTNIETFKSTNFVQMYKWNKCTNKTNVQIKQMYK